MAGLSEDMFLDDEEFDASLQETTTTITDTEIKPEETVKPTVT